MVRARYTGWVVLAVMVTACSGAPDASRTTSTTSTSATGTTTTTTTSTTPATTAPATSTSRRPTTTAPPKPKPAQNARPSTPPRPSSSLAGDTRNAIAYAPLTNPSAVVIEGSVPSSRAWSTSKVLIVAALLDTAADGDPARLTAEQRQWVVRALTASDADAVVALRGQIPGSPGAAITAVLRSIGDTQTVGPDRSQGSMQWSIREQVRFMAALYAGRVVSRAASAYLLGQMHPIAAHRWGLGTIGATSFKGGWLRSDTETRQMGLVDGYAVAIITAGVGPAVVQTDGDSAHVQQMNRLALLLQARLRAR